jgi:hypothetical protein
MKYYKTITCLLGTLLALSACAATTHQLELKIGKPTFTALSKSEQVSVVKVSEVRKPPYTLEGTPTDLSAQQITQLREFLLSDDSYNFNKIKRCLFIPEISYQFAGNKAIDVFVSFSCKKIKIVSEKNSSFIDYDPIAEKFNSFSQSLLNPSHSKISS